jgi:hypothetical protein
MPVYDYICKDCQNSFELVLASVNTTNKTSVDRSGCRKIDCSHRWVSSLAKVHHFRSRGATPALNRVNLPSGKRVKCLTFALGCPTLRPLPWKRIFPQPIDFEAVISRMWPKSALYIGLASQRPAIASFSECPLVLAASSMMLCYPEEQNCLGSHR